MGGFFVNMAVVLTNVRFNPINNEPFPITGLSELTNMVLKNRIPSYNGLMRIDTRLLANYFYHT